jgi:hypothetical protein
VIFDIERAKRTNFREPVLAAIEAAYQWAPGSIAAVLAGRRPEPLPLAAPARGRAGTLQAPVRNGQTVAETRSPVVEEARQLAAEIDELMATLPPEQRDRLERIIQEEEEAIERTRVDRLSRLLEILRTTRDDPRLG